MTPRRALSQPEFVAMIAMILATVAFSIDAMLPALPRIAEELSPGSPNAAQLIVTSFMLGMGMGTFFAGPISDAIGRKPTLMWGFSLYAVGAVAAIFAPTLETLLLARVIQGLGASAPRIVSNAMVRDQFEGRRMAQIMSFVMMIFILVPAMAPFFGSVIIEAFGWRAIFATFLVVALIGSSWLHFRQPETLLVEHTPPLRAGPLKMALREVLANPMVRLYTLVMTLGFGQLIAFISSVQQMFSENYGIVDNFPLWFMAIALLSGTSTIVNARLVMRLGMRRLAIAAFATQTIISIVLLSLGVTGIIAPILAFPVFIIWSVSIFSLAGLTFGNLNALALEPMGHIAGMAASVIGAISTIGAVLIAVPIGLAFNGTTMPLMTGTLICSGAAWYLMRKSREADPTPKTKLPGH